MRGKNIVSKFLISLALCLPVMANADTKHVGNAWLFVQAQPGVPAWKAQAIKQTLLMYLSSYKRIALHDAENLSDAGCKLNNVDCILNFARTQDIDIVLMGTVTNTKFHLEGYDPRSHSLSGKTETFFGQNTSPEEFRHQLFQLTRPFTQIGGILDEEPPSSPKPALFFLAGILGAMVLVGLTKWGYTIGQKLFSQYGSLRRNASFHGILALLLLGGLAISVVKSVNYHPLYVKRMRILKEKIEKMSRLQQERDNGKR